MSALFAKIKAWFIKLLTGIETDVVKFEASAKADIAKIKGKL